MADSKGSLVREHEVSAPRLVRNKPAWYTSQKDKFLSTHARIHTSEALGNESKAIPVQCLGV